MAKSDEEFDLCGTSPPHRTDFLADCGPDCVHETSTLFNWRVVKRHHRRRCPLAPSGGAPPAPPSTPTSLTASATPTPSPTAISNTNSIVAATTAAAEVDERLNSLFYIYTPKYKIKVNKEQQRTDAELASLLNVITLNNTSSSSSSSSKSVGGGGSVSSALNVIHSTPLEHRICAASRTIKKPAATSMKIFKIHRNPKWFFREPDHEEDSVSAPEYDDSEERELVTTRFRRQLHRRKLKIEVLRKRRFAHFQQQERMEALMHDFGNAMTFNEV